MKIGIIGCSGRMGIVLIEETVFNHKTELSGGIVKHDSEYVGLDLGTIANLDAVGINASSNIETIISDSDAIIDFTNPELTLKCANIAANNNTIHVTGTTGFTAEQQKELANFSERTPIIWSANMSVGINILNALVEQTASILGTDYDIEIVEMHHCHKVDAPSGTALQLGEAAARGRNVNLDDVARKSREGIIGKRPEGEIGFATLRGGDVVGEHSVIFAGDGERIEITHKASHRKIFAKGAVRAALWAKNKKPGLYSMAEVLLQK